MISFENARKETLASTACWVAAVRARENEREDRLFDDPWATLLVGQAGEVWQERMTGIQCSIDRSIDHMSIDRRLSLRWGHLGKKSGRPRLRLETIVPERLINKSADQQEVPTEIGIVIRTKFFDDFLLRATRVHQIPQVVILASGMDTRAYRLNWSKQTRLFEIDQPAVLQQKRQILSSVGATPNCWRMGIGADLEGPWSGTLVRKADFDPHQTSVWLIEGLLPYLSESAVLRLLEKVTELSTPGSWLGLTAMNRETLTSDAARQWVNMMEEAGIPWLSTMDEPEALLAKLGWVATVVQPGEEQANFDRWPYPVVPRSVPNIPRTWLVTAIRSS